MKRLILLLVCIIGISIGASASTGNGISKTGNKLAKIVTATTGLVALSRGKGALNNLEQEALQDLENYEGSQEYSRIYTGMRDDFVSFDGAEKSFANELGTGRTFDITVKELTGAAGEFYLFPSFKEYNADGTLKSGVVAEGDFWAIGVTVGDKNFNGLGTPSKIHELMRFLNQNPARLVGFKMTADSAATIAGMRVLVEPQSPFKNLEDRTINPGLYQNEKTENDKIVTITEGFDTNDQNRIKINMPANGEVTFNLIFGAILNPAAALKSKHNRFARSRG